MQHHEHGTTRHVSPWWLARDVVVLLLAFAVGGALCGVWWEWWWTPPGGVVVDHTWYADLDGVRGLFSGTALYVVVAATGGLVLGILSAWFFDRVEVVTMVTVLAGSALAGAVMYLVGTELAPPDPRVVARSVPDHTEVPGSLEVSGKSPFIAFPAAALTGVAAVFIGLAPSRPKHG